MAELPSSPHLRAKSPFPALWTGFLLMALLTVVALGLSIGQWSRPIAGMLVDPFGWVDNFGWPGWSGYRHGLAYPDRINAVAEHRLDLRAPGDDLDRIASDKIRNVREGTNTSIHTSTSVPLEPPHAGGASLPHGMAAEPSLRLLVEQGQGFRMVSVQVERVGVPAWLVLCGGYLLLAWVWLGAAGILYTARPQSRAVGSFVRWVMVAAVLLITLFDFHTTRMLVPITLVAYACLPAALIEIGLCFPERIPLLQARPQLLWLLRLCDAALAGLLLYGFIRHRSFRGIADVATGVSIVALTILFSLRCVQAEGRRRVQLLVALLLLLPIYLLVGGMLLWSPEHAAPYLYVVVIPATVLGALGMAYALLRFDLWDSRTLLRKPGLRPLLSVVLAFVVSLLAAIGFVGTRGLPDAVQVLYLVGMVGGTGVFLRRASEWIDAKLFPADVRYQATVEQLSMRFTDLASTAAVAEVVEQALVRSVDCARVRLLPVAAPVWSAGNDSKGLGRFLPKVAQVMAAAIENQRTDLPESAVHSDRAEARSATVGRDSGEGPAPAAVPPNQAPLAQGLQPLRSAVKAAGLFSLTPEQEQALLKGELVYLAPVKQLTYSVQALWSWLLIAVRFRDHIIGLIAVAPKSVAQVFTPATESLLRTIANQAALALFCAGLSEQAEARRRTQESLLHTQADLAMSALAHEVRHALPTDPTSLSNLQRALESLAQPPRPKLAPLRLRTVIEQGRLLLHDRLRARLLELDLLPALELDGDRESVALIISNLLDNALSDCPAHGRVGITTRIEPDQRLCVAIWHSQAHVSAPTLDGKRDSQSPDAGQAGPSLLARIDSPGSEPAIPAEQRRVALHHAIAELLLQAHGWQLRHARHAGRHEAEILIPESAWRRKRTVDGEGAAGHSGDALGESQPGADRDPRSHENSQDDLPAQRPI